MHDRLLPRSWEPRAAHEYKPSRSKAQALIPELEICWGTIAIRQSDGDHRYERCNCPPRETTFSLEGRMEPTRGEEQEAVLQIYFCYLDAHTL